MTGANAATTSSPQPGLYVFTRQHDSIVAVNGTTARQAAAPKDPAKLTDAEKVAQYEVWNTLMLIQKSAAGQPASETRTKLTRLE